VRDGAAEELIGAPAAPSLHGRADLVSDVGARLRPSAVVALVGAPGVGKSAVARAVADAFGGRSARHRVVWNQGLADEDGAGAGDDPGGLLVVVDGAGDEIDARVDEVRATFPEAAVLAVGLRAVPVADAIVDVAPLPLPATPAALESSPAWALFAERARAVRGGLELDAADRPFAHEVLAATDGLPLAIFVLASQLRSASLRRLAERLRSPDTTTGRRWGAPLVGAVRAATLGLGAGELSVLSQCAAIPAPFDVETALALVAAPDGVDVEEALVALRERSLLQATSFGGAGIVLRVLGCVRDVVADPSVAGPVAARHAAHFARAKTISIGMPADVARDHLSAALLALPPEDWAGARALVERAAALCRRAGSTPRLSSAAEAWAARAPAGGEAPLRASAGLLACFGGDSARGVALALAARGDARTDEERAATLRALGLVQFFRGHLAEARAALEEASRADPTDGVKWVDLAGILVLAGDTVSAEAALERAAVEARRRGALDLVAWADLRKAELLLDLGEEERAALLLDAALAYGELHGDARLRATASGDVGLLALLRGDGARAEACFRESREVLEGIGLGSSAATMRWAIAAAHEVDERPDDALVAYEDAVLAARLAKNDLALGLALAGLGRCLADRQELDRADARLAEAARLFDGTGDARRRAVVAIAAAHAAIARGEPSPSSALEAPAIVELSRRSAEVRLALTLARRRLGAASERPATLRDAVRLGEILVDRDGGSLQLPDGKRVDLATRGAPKRILAHLVARYAAAPHATATLEELFAAGWPGVRVSARSAASRVYVAISTLRGAGLGPILRRTSEGYGLDPSHLSDEG